MIKKLKGSKAKSTALEDVYELVASLIFSGHGFAIELRGVSEASGATSATAIIARELDEPEKVYFLQDANTFEDALEALRDESGSVLGKDRCDRRGGCCRRATCGGLLCVCLHGRCSMRWVDVAIAGSSIVHMCPRVSVRPCLYT